ncbi:MAG: hypothetical protein ACLTS6_15320 [Anaerobutyricum sp.]
MQKRVSVVSLVAERKPIYSSMSAAKKYRRRENREVEFPESKKVSEDRKRFFAPKAKVLIVDDSQQNLRVPCISFCQRTSMQLDKAWQWIRDVSKKLEAKNIT